MSSPRLLVVDPSAKFPEIEGARVAVGDWPGEARVITPVLCPEEMPSPGDGYDAAGIVLMGSAASVHDDDPWLISLSEWLEPVVRGQVRIPLLGICFGHQLVADLAGGAVRFLREDQGKLVGVRNSSLTGSRLLPGEGEMKVVVSHREEVTAVPDRYRVTATRPESAHDGLEHEALPIYTCQFHPEARLEFAGTAGIDPDLIDDELQERNAAFLAAFRQICSGTGT
jgi:GMP synthase (glutamine-hydrolysing)